jgi:hypothetical protein
VPQLRPEALRGVVAYLHVLDVNNNGVVDFREMLVVGVVGEEYGAGGVVVGWVAFMAFGVGGLIGVGNVGLSWRVSWLLGMVGVKAQLGLFAGKRNAWGRACFRVCPLQCHRGWSATTVYGVRMRDRPRDGRGDDETFCGFKKLCSALGRSPGVSRRYKRAAPGSQSLVQPTYWL